MSRNRATFTFPQVCIVEASAGSGKTYALARRYIQLLINPYLPELEIPLRNILAITFTNKAAVEMKERILELLKKIAFDQFTGPEEEKDVLSALFVDKETARKRAYLVMEHLIKNYNFFQVKTIDSFINSLLSGCSFRLDLSSTFKIKEDYQEYLKYSLDKLIERAGTEKEIFTLFDSFLRQYLYLENKTSWFPKRDILALLGMLFSDSNIYGGKFQKSPGRGKDLFECKRMILKLMQKLKAEIPEGTEKRFVNSLTSFLEKNAGGFAVDEISEYFSREDFPVRKNYPVPAKTGKLWKNIRVNLGRLCELEAALLFNCYLDIFQPVLTDMKTLSSKKDILFLEELNRQARLLFDEEAVTVEELYYRMATRFRHYLIDEFQDTSILQWKNLFLMVEEALATDGSLFYVGDKKQAIYRFRGGEVSLFDFVRERFRAFNVREELLSRNYRSHREIVEFNNDIFSRENLSRFIAANDERRKDGIRFRSTDADDILATFHDSRQTWREGNIHGFVRVEPVDSDDSEETEAVIKKKVIGLIKDLRTRFAYKDIALLSRDNLGVEMITSWLLEAGIAVESEKTLNIRENALIKELVSLLKFLNSPIDDLAFASFILGDIFLRASGLDRRTVEDFIFHLQKERKEHAVLYLYREFQHAFPAEWNSLLENFFRQAGFAPLYELVISIFHEFKIPENFAEYQGFFLRFLELIKKQEEEYADIASFLEYFDRAREDDLYVSVAGADSVKALTVHKAKGLEFEVVIIPFLKLEVKAGTGNRSYIVGSEDSHLRLLRLKKAYRKYSRILEEAYRQEYKKSFIDELNNIYVALTRARKELYIFLPRKSGVNFNLANLLIPREQLQRGIKRKYPERAGRKELTLKKIPPSKYQDWMTMLKDEFIGEGEVRNRERILRGEILHFLLSYSGNLSRQDPEQVISAAREGVPGRFPAVTNLPELCEQVRAVWRKEEFGPVFFVGEGTVLTEKEIVGSTGNTLRIDRLVVKENEVWVIDYKSSRDEPEKHRAQIEEYIKAVRDLYPGRTVKGFLLYLDEMDLERVL